MQNINILGTVKLVFTYLISLYVEGKVVSVCLFRILVDYVL